jgi:hypothetical protein
LLAADDCAEFFSANTLDYLIDQGAADRFCGAETPFFCVISDLKTTICQGRPGTNTSEDAERHGVLFSAGHSCV